MLNIYKVKLKSFAFTGHCYVQADCIAKAVELASVYERLDKASAEIVSCYKIDPQSVTVGVQGRGYISIAQIAEGVEGEVVVYSNMPRLGAFWNHILASARRGAGNE